MVRVLAGLVLSVFAVAWTASAAPEVINPKAVEGVFLSLDSGVSPNAIRDLRMEQGYYRYLGAPMGASFQAPAGKGNGSFESIAREYVMSHYGAFGMKSNAVDFVAGKSVYQPKQVFIHLKQTYRGVRVFAGTAIVQVDYNGRVRSVNSDIMRDARMLDKNMVSTVPTLSVQAAQQSAVAAMTSEFSGSTFTSAGDGRLFVYDPEVLGDTGPVRLVWQVTVRSALPGLTHALLVDATTGAVVIKYPLEHSALNRQIYDAGNTNADPGQLARGEGGAESGVPDVNDAYDYYGDTYVFYADTHGRDSIDGIGMALSATTRYCPFTDFACPYENAFWSFDLLRMYFGEGFAEADDVVSHELTHGVTQFTSNLIYFRESGAINESFSDMWGEWVDLTNGSADDTAQNRWLLGEGLVTANFPVIRNMKNPPLFGHPDRLKSPLYFTLPDDNYGVHINSGIGNKLCYLLTDGSAGEPNGTFNGRAVAAMGIRAGDVLSDVGASEIMYYVQANLLSPASDYLDLGAAIQEAGIALELSTDLQRNIKRAGEAVEIIEASENALGTVQNFRAIHTDGSQLIQLSWDIAQVDLIDRVEVYRSTNGFALEPSQGLKIYEGTETLFVDGPLPDNAEVFYSIFLYQLVGESLIPVVTERQFARAVVGKDRPDEQTELFTAGSDLAFKQILFSPSVDTDVAFDSGVPEGYVNYTNYMRQTTDAEVLPVSRANSIKLPPTDDSLITIFLPRATPFFGSLISELLVSPRGFMLSKAAVTSSNAQYGASRVYDIEALSQPTLTSHFSVPRVSFFLSNVSPATSGERWIKILDDRFVVTYERVPTQGSNLPNTCQA